jgi:hypothetical protein
MQLAPLRPVLQHIDAHRSDEMEDVGLFPAGAEGLTVLHAAARLADGSIACTLLSTPGIASPSSWYKLTTGGLTPDEVAAHNYLEVMRRSLSNSGAGGSGGGGSAEATMRLPGVLVPNVISVAINIAVDALRRATATLDDGADVEGILEVGLYNLNAAWFQPLNRNTGMISWFPNLRSNLTCTATSRRRSRREWTRRKKTKTIS